MEAIDLEKLGLNRNEAKVYLALIQKNKSTVNELVKSLGMHRAMVYDNLEKLIEKGLVSFFVQETRKIFVAEEPDSIIEFLESKKQQIDSEIKTAEKIMPQITQMLKYRQEEQETKVFRGIKGVKKVLSETLKSKEIWGIGISNASVEVLSATYWKNYNSKVIASKITEHYLLNADFNDEYEFETRKYCSVKRLPTEMIQITEILLFNEQVAVFIYSANPTAIMIKDKNLFISFRNQFDFLWKKAK